MNIFAKMAKKIEYYRTIYIYMRRFKKYSFVDCQCKLYEQYEASIIRLYHTIEKGLAYESYRPGFGKENINKLVFTLEQFANKYGTDSFCYETALSCLETYISKNKAYGIDDLDLQKRINKLPGKKNALAGTILVSMPNEVSQYNFEQIMKSRHSIRSFSSKPVDVAVLKQAIALAQYTPSACNRQGWKTRIVSDKEIISAILSNQNGNRGFGQEIDKLLIITADLRAQQKSREVFQAFIEGGMYSESVINSLYYYNIGSIPLSAALTVDQEKKIRSISKISDAESFILFIGVGNYPENAILTTKSTRKATDIEVL